MTDTFKVKIWKVMSASNHFWITTLILYFIERGLTLQQALIIMSIYSIANVLLEYPTGVVGDYFSHKLSCTLGVLLAPIFFALLTLSGGFTYYSVVILIASLGISLVSGSDVALLHSISKDFKKDTAQIAPYGIIMSVITAAVGAFVAEIDIRYPLYLSLIYAALSLPFLLTIKTKNNTKEKASGNIFSVASDGVKDVFRSSKLLSLVIISSVWGAFFLGIKWFYNPLFGQLNIAVKYWGLIANFALLLMVLGVKLYKKFESISLYVLSTFGIICIIFVGQLNIVYLPIAGIWLGHIMRGYQETKLSVEINEAIVTSRRASILSFNSLLTRLISAIFIAGGGLLLTQTSFRMFSVVVAIAIGILVSMPLLKNKI